MLTIRVTEVGSCILKKMLREAGAEPSDVENYYSELGTVVHTMAKHFIADHFTNKEIQAVDYYISKGIEDGANPDFVSQNKPVLEERIRRLSQVLPVLSIMEPRLEEQESAKLELSILVEENNADKTVLISGTPDVITDDFVIDFKSGKTRSKKHAWQVAAYDMLGNHDRLDKPNSPRTGIIIYLGDEVSVKVLKNGKVKCNAVRIIPPTDMEEYMVEWYNALWEHAKKLEETTEQPDPAPHPDCFFCEYKSYCGMGEPNSTTKIQSGYEENKEELL